jgi:hypothetical protein
MSHKLLILLGQLTGLCQIESILQVPDTAYGNIYLQMASKVGLEKKEYPVSDKSRKGRERSTPAKDPVFPGQHEGEEVQFIFRQHPAVMRKYLILGLLIVLIGVAPLDLPIVYQYPWLSSLVGKFALVMLVVAIFIWIGRYIQWYYSCTIVTMERIIFIKQQGFFKREVDALFHGRIHALDYKTGGLYASLMGFGDLEYLTEVGNFYTHYVPHVVKIHEQILGVIRDNRDSDEWRNENYQVM